MNPQLQNSSKWKVNYSDAPRTTGPELADHPIDRISRQPIVLEVCVYACNAKSIVVGEKARAPTHAHKCSSIFTCITTAGKGDLVRLHAHTAPRVAGLGPYTRRGTCASLER